MPCWCRNNRHLMLLTAKNAQSTGLVPPATQFAEGRPFIAWWYAKQYPISFPAA
jgi:hypothetical protein